MSLFFWLHHKSIADPTTLQETWEDPLWWFWNTWNFESILSQQSKEGFGSFLCCTWTHVDDSSRKKRWNSGLQTTDQQKSILNNKLNHQLPFRELTYPPASRHEFESMMFRLSHLVGYVSSSFLEGDPPNATPPPRNKALLRDYKPLVSLTKPFFPWSSSEPPRTCRREVWIGWEAP